MAPTKVVLLSCGSFNPPTNMHLRMFEISRDYLHRIGGYVVVGGLMSPVHDSYGKQDLVSATDRCAMVRLALQGSEWVKLSDWECKQENWKRTRSILQYHQNNLNAVLNNYQNENIEDLVWIPENIRNGCTGPVQVKLLCGGDLLESFGTPGLWSDDDIEAIVGQHGLVVITREGSNPWKFIYDSDILTKYMANIIIVTEWIKNEVSSTKIRRALRRSESVKYLVPDPVIDYIHKYKLYGTNELKYLSPINYNDSIFLTPSPSDIIMTTPSPLDNNPLFSNNNVKKLHLDNVDNLNNTNTQLSHPGQAVKIITQLSSDQKTIKTQVGTNDLPNSDQVIKSAKSFHNFSKQSDEKIHRFKSSKSNDHIEGYKDCDENLIKFIFTKHGIQVLSDVETVV